MGTSKYDAQLARVVFVIIGRNEGERLRTCLQSVRALSDQVIYADSNSTDGSPQLARSLGAITVEISSPPLNAARGRNEGFAAAREHFPDAEFVQFLDGDCLLEAAWPEVAVKFLDHNPSAAVACGRRYEAFPQASFYNQLADSEWDTPIGQAQACGGDAMMRIAALHSIGGFDSQLMAGEEPELCSRLRASGWSIWRLDQLMTAHDSAIYYLGQWWRRALRSGYGYAQVWRKTRAAGDPLYARQLVSSFFWSLLIPIGIGGLTLLFERMEILALLPLVYILQIGRTAARRSGPWGFRLRSAALLMLAKLAELLGAVLWLLAATETSINYKAATKNASAQ